MTGRYSVTIEKQQEKNRLPFLKRPFTEEEMDILKKMYEDGVHPRIIADRLGRKEPSVKAKIKSLAPYFQNPNEPLLFHLPLALVNDLGRINGIPKDSNGSPISLLPFICLRRLGRIWIIRWIVTRIFVIPLLWRSKPTASNVCLWDNRLRRTGRVVGS